MIIFSPTPRAMSRTIHKWLLRNGGEQYRQRMIETIMCGHHAKLKPFQQAMESFYGPATIFGVVRDPVTRCVSAYHKFKLRDKDETFQEFLPRWFHFAPDDESMLSGLDNIFKFEDGAEPIFDWLRNELNTDAPTPVKHPRYHRPDRRPDRPSPRRPDHPSPLKPEPIKLIEPTSSDIKSISDHYHWTYTNFDY